jgi:hydrogenase expression/formation protein HypC
MACVPEAELGDYVVVHAGVAIARVDRVAAEAALTEIQRRCDARDGAGGET